MTCHITRGINGVPVVQYTYLDTMNILLIELIHGCVFEFSHDAVEIVRKGFIVRFLRVFYWSNK